MTLKMTYNFKTLPDHVQLDGLRRALKAGKYGIFFQQRVGKTRVAIDYLGALWLAKQIKRVVIITPLSARGVWLEQFEEHMSEDVQYDIKLFPSNSKTFFSKFMPDVLQVVVINYDKLSTQKDVIRKWKPDCYIFDESHLLKNPNSSRSKAAYNISKGVEYCLLLTGTPIPKKPHDIFSQFRVMNDKIFGKSWPQFRREHCIMGGYMDYEVVGYTNPEKLSRTMARHSIRALRKDVMKEPKVEQVTVPVELEPNAKKFYETLKRDFIAELETIEKEGRVLADSAGVRVMKLQQVCGGFISTEEGVITQVSEAKVKQTSDLVETIVEGGNSVVIFYRFTAEGNALVKAIENRGYKTGLFNGATKEQDRQTLREDFQAGKLPVLILQIATGAMGIALHKAHNVIFYSMDFSLANFQQARDRVMGREQKNDVTLWFMTIKGTVDEKIMRVLRKDEELASSISDRWRWLLGDKS